MALNYDAPIKVEELPSALASTALAPATSQAITALVEKKAVAAGGSASDATVEAKLFTPTVTAGKIEVTKEAVGGTTTPALLIVDAKSATAGTDVTVEFSADILQGSSAVVLDTQANVKATFDAVEAVIVSGSGDDVLTFTGNTNATVVAGDGNDTLTFSGGDNSITLGSGKNLVNLGSGNSTVLAGTGNDTIVVGTGNDTISGGGGFDVVQFGGAKTGFTPSKVDGKLVVKSATSETTVSDVKYLSFAGGNSLVVASSEKEAGVMRLYKAVLGRDADQGGAEYWSNTAEAASEVAMANAFIMASELNSSAVEADEAFVNLVYQNAFGRAADADGLAYWVNDLANGQARANVLVNIAGSQEAAVTIDNVFLL